jgi:cyclohexanecarboxylate-CoA ligase
MTAESFGASYFRSQRWWRDETLADWLEQRASADPDRTAVLTGSGRLSYRELWQRSQAFGAGLQKRGIRPGDVVAVHLSNAPEFLIAWLGINRIGAVLQTVHTPYGPRELAHLLQHGRAKACIALAKAKDRSPVADLLGLRRELPSLAHVISVQGSVDGAETFEAILQSGEVNPAQAPPVSATDLFMLLYTSGTTSSPKAVAVSYNHFLSNARMCAGEFNITADDRILCLAPYTHLYGLYSVELGLSAGASICILDLFTPASFVKALQELRPTMLFAGPAHIAPCIHHGMFDELDLSDLRIAVLSGSTVPIALSEAFEQKLPRGKVLQAWGMTELQFGACSRPNDSEDIRFRTIGRATPGTELRVVDTEGKVLGAEAIGELQVRGCSIFSGYVGNEEANRAAFMAEGWFRTGDLAQMDQEGNVELKGRTKELINRGGIKFNPIDMEIAIASHPSVLQVAIAPVPDPVVGERAGCFITTKEGASLSFDGLKQFLSEKNFAKFTWPEHFVIVREMPMTPTRKVIKSELVRRYISELGRPGSPAQ